MFIDVLSEFCLNGLIFAKKSSETVLLFNLYASWSLNFEINFLTPPSLYHRRLGFKLIV